MKLSFYIANQISISRGYFTLVRLLLSLENGKYRSDFIMCLMASQITGVSIVCLSVCLGSDQKISKPRVTGLCEGNPPVICGFCSQRASNAKNVSIWWRHHGQCVDYFVITESWSGRVGHLKCSQWLLSSQRDCLSVSMYANFIVTSGIRCWCHQQLQGRHLEDPWFSVLSNRCSLVKFYAA